MADVNEIISKQAIDGIFAADKAIKDTNTSLNGLIKTIESNTNKQKENKISTDSLNKSRRDSQKTQKGLDATTQELIKLDKKMATAEIQLTNEYKQVQKAVIQKTEASKKATAALKEEVTGEKAAAAALKKTITAEKESIAAKKRLLAVKESLGKQRSKEFLKEEAAATKNLNVKLKQEESARKALNAQRRRGLAVMAKQEFQQKNIKKSSSGLIKVFKAQVIAMATMAAGYLGIQTVVRGISKSVKIFATFDRQISKVGAISGATGEELTELRNLAQKLGESTEKTAVEVAQLEINLSKLGFTSKQILEATGAILDFATAADADLGQAATVAAATVKGFGLQAKDTQRIVDVMALSFSSSALDIGKFENAMSKVAPVAKNADVSVERATASLSLLTDRGLEASIAGTSLRNIFLELSKQGLTWEEAMGKIRTATDKNRTALELFGKRGATAAIILAENAKEADLLTTKYENSAGAAKRMADIMRDNLVGDTDKAKSALEGLAINLVGKLNPSLRSAVQGFTNFIGKINELVKVNPSEELRKEQVQLNVLVGRITDVNIEQEQRNELLGELQIKYPDFLENLNTETVTNEQLAKNLKLVNDEFVKRIIVATQIEKLEKEGRKAADARIKAIEFEVKLRTRLTQVATKFGIENELVGKTLEEQIKIIDNFKDSSEATLFQTKQIRAEVTSFNTALKNLGRNTEKANKAQTKFNDISSIANQIIKDNTTDTEDQTEATNENTEAIKRQSAAIVTAESIEAIQAILDLNEAEEQLAEDAFLRSEEDREMDELKEALRNSELEGLEDFFARKAQLEEEDIERKRVFTEAEIELDELKRTSKERYLGILGSLFGRETTLGKLAYLAQRGLAVARIIADTGVANAKAVLASPLTFGQPWVGINTIRSKISIATILAQAIKGFKTGTKGKYDTPDTFVTSEDHKTEFIEKAGKIIRTDEPTLHTGKPRHRVYSNPEVNRIMNNQMGNTDMSGIMSAINKTGQNTVTAVKNIKTLIVDEDLKVMAFKRGNYRRNYI